MSNVKVEVVNKIEQAARDLCKARGIDPEEDRMNEWGFYYPAWHDAKKEIAAALQVQSVIARHGLTFLDAS
jgi:hypothetical protein